VKLNEAIQVLVGEKLSSVTFVLDYWGLDFDGHGFTIYSRIFVDASGVRIADGEAGFRDSLCGLLGRQVDAASFDSAGAHIRLGDATVTLSTIEEEYRGPEALLFDSPETDATYVV
jgi:hypothetical protein